jgi:membrane protease YdiL (CAAX protease family)
MSGQATHPHRSGRVFKNRFGHLRAGWRILAYLACAVILSQIFDLFQDPYLLIQGNALSDQALLWNRFVSKSFQLLAVFIPGVLLLRFVDRRPVALLGLGFYKGALRELVIGMFMGFVLIVVSVSVLWLAGWARFSFNGVSTGLLMYLLGVLIILTISAAYEELLFRGYVFQSLIEGSNIWITLLVFSLLFAAAHLTNEGVTAYSIATTVIAGVFVGVVYFKTRALWMCIGAHFMWNWTMCPLFGIGLSESRFLRRSLFAYEPSEASFIHGQDAMSEIVLGILVLGVTICLWRAKWLRPAERNRSLWRHYPPRYGVEPGNGA